MSELDIKKVKAEIKRDIKCHLKEAMIESYDEMIAEIQEMKTKLIEGSKL